MGYETVIGLEIHCELATTTKIFCSCPTSFGAQENEHVCPICLGMPGTLPKLNEKAVEYAVRAGLALNCTIANYSKFDRKNYFYPDLPKAYQISQYDKPICENGYLEISDDDGNLKRVGITRIHLEEDAGKLVHQSNSTLLDNNRCGVPLIEIVTEPDMRSAGEAERFARQVRAILRAVRVSDCKMQEGSIRFDVNLSVHEKGEDFGTRTEMKNLNSFRSLVRAAEYEQQRQIALINEGKSVLQETRRWDDDKGISLGMRSKEDAHDYRYFPDPDLVPVVLTDEYIEEVKNALPELPMKREQRYQTEYGLSENEAKMLTDDIDISELFEKATITCNNPKTVANFILGDLFALSKDSGDDYSALKFTAEQLGTLIKTADTNVINLSTAKKVFAEMYTLGSDPTETIEKKGLTQISDLDEIRAVVKEVINNNPQSVADIKSGKQKAAGFITGQVMKQTRGKANPQIVNGLIKEIIDEM